METNTHERLGEDVHELLAGANVLDADLAGVDATTEGRWQRHWGNNDNRRSEDHRKREGNEKGGGVSRSSIEYDTDGG
jgi:hypothetical protein